MSRFTRSFLFMLIVLVSASTGGLCESSLRSIVPAPHSVQELEGQTQIASSLRILSGLMAEEIDTTIAFELGRILEKKSAIKVTIAKEKDVTGTKNDLYIGSGVLNPGLNKIIAANNLTFLMNRESFIIIVSPEGMGIWGSDSAGLLYGSLAFAQLVTSASEGEATVPNCIIHDVPDTQFRAAHVKPDTANYPYVKEIVREILPRCRMNYLFMDMENMAVQEGDVEKGLLPESQMKLLCQLAMDREMEIIPVVASFEASPWTHEEHPEQSQEPFWNDPVFFSALLRRYIIALDLVRPEYFHVGFAQDKSPYAGDIDMPYPEDETRIIAEHFLRLRSLLEARNAMPMIWGEMFLGEDTLKPGAIERPVSEDEARRRREAMHPDELIFCLKLGISKIDSNRCPALDVLRDERFEVILLSDSESVSSRLRLPDQQIMGEGYIFNKLQTRGERAGEITSLVSLSDSIWNEGTKQTEERHDLIKKVALEWMDYID